MNTTQTSRPPVWRVLLYALLALGLLSGLPYVRGVPPLVGTAVATVVFLLLSLLIIREMARFPLAPLWDFMGALVSLSLWYAAGPYAEQYPSLKPLLAALAGLLFMVACVFFGRLLSLIVRERNMMLPVAIMAGLADVFTVFMGPTGEALKHAPKLVEKLSVGIPQVGSATGAAGGAGLATIATAGLGDFIFLAFFFAGMYRFGLRERRTFWVIFVAVLLGMGAVLLLPAVPALPLLPFIVLGFLIANAGTFKLSRQEKVAMVVVVAAVTGLLVGAGLAMRG
ncbi:MAG: hypothetical protein ABFD96_22650 [Armatimonadia bacterium]